MFEDAAIQYNAIVIEVEDNLKQLEKLQMNTQNYNVRVLNIKEDVKKEIQKCYDNYDNTDSNFLLHDAIITIYQNAIKVLDKINTQITNEYESYYKIYVYTNELNKKIDNISYYDINELVSETLELLKNIKKTTSIDYEQEKSIVENIYSLVYKMMITELIYTNNTVLFDQVKSDNIDTAYISKLIKDEIKKSKSIKPLEDKIQEIEKNGFEDTYYIDKELIILLSTYGNSKLIKEVRNRFSNQVDNYNKISTQLDDIKSEEEDSINKISRFKNENIKIFGKKTLKKALILINMIGLGAAVSFTGKGLKSATMMKKYETITTTYDSSLDEQESPTIEFLKDAPNSTSIIEYSPWEEPGYFRDNYKRNVYTYTFNSGSEIFYEDVKDYLNKELKEYMTITEKIDYSEEVPLDLDYRENKYVITQTVQDKTNYEKVERPEAWITLTIVLGLVYYILDLLLINKLSNKFFNGLNDKKISNKELLVQLKHSLLESRTNIRELTQQLFNLKSEIEKEYLELPTTLQQDEVIKQNVLTLTSNEKNK